MDFALTLESESGIGRAEITSDLCLGFVLLWSRDEPGRIGEVTLMPAMEPGTQAVLGRGEAPAGDDHPRLEWMRQQPGRIETTGPLGSRLISRTQLHIEVHGPRLLHITNVGRCPLMHEARQVGTMLAAPGDLLELRNRVLLMCIQRPRSLVHEHVSLPEHRFGAADANGIVGESPTAWRLRDQIAFVAERNAHVLVVGASGTGKELVAQAIHRLSPRGHKPLVSRNAATFPETLIDAELFGSARGYPNPGMPERPGLIGEAHGSTLFLDEFAELPHALQTHLLRVLDAGEYTRLGESRARSSDFRLIAATNRPEHALKEDVLARLRLRVEVCGIDQRREDIPLIARHILRRLARDDAYIAQRYFPDADPSGHPLISRALIEYLVRHTYSTHVRELEAMLWRAMSHAQGDILDLWPVEPSPGGVAALASSALAVDAAVFRPVVDAGMDTAACQPAVDDAGTRPVVDPMSLAPEVIQECLDRHEGRQEPVWRELGLSSRHVLTRLVRRYGLIVRGRDR